MCYRMAVCLFAIALTALSADLSRANQGSPFDLTPPQATPPQKPESPAPLPEIKQPSADAAPATPAPGTGAPKADNAVSGCGLPYHLVEETCYVPILVHEKRKVQCIEYTTEQHEQQISLMRLVPEKQTIKQQYTVLVPETQPARKTTPFASLFNRPTVAAAVAPSTCRKPNSGKCSTRCAYRK